MITEEHYEYTVKTIKRHITQVSRVADALPKREQDFYTSGVVNGLRLALATLTGKNFEEIANADDY